MFQAGLVLEGGGMKGMYTAGVLDYFIEKDMEFSKCYGVSAGSIHMCNLISKQKGRGLRTGLDYLDDRNYCSMYSLIKTGDLFGADFCYRKIPTELDPYDYETFSRYKGKAYAVITNIITGKPEYYQIKDLKKDIVGVRASSSLPLVSRSVRIGQQLYLDGGISDSIPIRKSIADGNQKNVVILTKEEGYVRKPSSKGMNLFIKQKYRKYPELYKCMLSRHIEYNETVAFLEEQQKMGEIFVIRPKEPLNIGRTEKNREKLKAIYQIGYEDAKACYEELLSYLDSSVKRSSTTCSPT